MGKVTIKKREYKGWQNCIEITNNLIDIIATTDVGPRLIRFGFTGKENMFCEVEDQVGTTGGTGWKIYGGHRLWHSPEHNARTYEPDNSSIEWKEIKNGIILSQPVEPWTQMKKEIEVTMSPEEAKVTVLHRIINKGAWPVEYAVWALSVMAPGGKQVMPQVTKDTGLLPNRMVSLWPYTKLNDSRVSWGEKYIMLQQDKNAASAFKIGLPNEDGWAAYINKGCMFVKKYQHLAGKSYPDYGSSYETYTCDFMMEMETLSPLTMVNPGDYIEHSETWYLYDNVRVPADEQDISRFILPLIK